MWTQEGDLVQVYSTQVHELGKVRFTYDCVIPLVLSMKSMLVNVINKKLLGIIRDTFVYGGVPNNKVMVKLN